MSPLEQTSPRTGRTPACRAYFHGEAPVTSRKSRQFVYNHTMSGTPAHYSEEHLLAYPVEYIAGIDLYNAGEYHAAHDAWEERWMGPVAPEEKIFLQAMIQSAVAFHHLQIGRPGAARRMYLMAKEKFARLNTLVFMSLDLADYQAQLDRALSWLLTVPDPRQIEQPKIEAPLIRLVPIANANR
ncbi:MAG: DUF309 domain-containing protein [Pyrinomonadaceae bacterium]